MPTTHDMTGLSRHGIQGCLHWLYTSACNGHGFQISVVIGRGARTEAWGDELESRDTETTFLRRKRWWERTRHGEKQRLFSFQRFRPLLVRHIYCRGDHYEIELQSHPNSCISGRTLLFGSANRSSRRYIRAIRVHNVPADVADGAPAAYAPAAAAAASDASDAGERERIPSYQNQVEPGPPNRWDYLERGEPSPPDASETPNRFVNRAASINAWRAAALPEELVGFNRAATTDSGLTDFFSRLASDALDAGGWIEESDRRVYAYPLGGLIGYNLETEPSLGGGHFVSIDLISGRRWIFAVNDYSQGVRHHYQPRPPDWSRRISMSEPQDRPGTRRENERNHLLQRAYSEDDGSADAAARATEQVERWRRAFGVVSIESYDEGCDESCDASYRQENG